jgi:Protochlamydia outer membrane protein
MKIWRLLTVLALTMILTTTAQAAHFKTDLDVSTGYRTDDFDWNIAGNTTGNNPNVLSELTWRDLRIFQTEGAIRTLMNDVYCLRASFTYGRIYDGGVQDSDFAGNNRTGEFSRSNNSADGGNTLDALAGLGYQFRIGKFRFIPLAGYSYDKQNLTLRDGFQTLSVPISGATPPPVGPIPGLDSTYDATWQGPWLGFDLFFHPYERLTLFGTFEHHWADYEAKANLNLRTDLAHPTSFEHKADGTGFLVKAGAAYNLKGPWSLGLNVNYEKWSTDPGTDRAYYVHSPPVETRLNEVNWNSFAAMLSLTYRFVSK